MSINRPQFSEAQWCRWRRLTAAVVIYALVLQSLFFGFVAAPTLALASTDGFPAFELCQHGPDGAPVSPVDLPSHHGDNHCIFCFAGSNPHLGQGPQLLSLIRPVDLQSENAWWPIDSRRVSILSRYLIARPRGPPPGA
jgi:hypothetical protein